MRRLWGVALVGLAAASGCSQQAGGSSASLSGSQDLVVVDALGADGGLARVEALADGGVLSIGGPNEYVFVTSVNTNELRVLRMARPGALGRQWVPAPNPVETLAIPVLARPSMLAVDEGLHADGRRVTGAYVYAGRPGASVLSVVGAAPEELRAVTASPLPLPGPVTAFAAWIGQDLERLPATTTLYVATYDGARGAVYALTLSSDPAALREALTRPSAERPAPRAQRLFDVADESVMALQVMPPLRSRTLDGQPFCEVTACLAVSTRRAAGTGGRSFLVEPSSLRTAPLDFGGPVRDLATTGNGFRLFGVLDEEKCGGPACGGVVAVDTISATGPAGFQRALDFSGQPMQPITTGEALPTGLSLAQGVDLRTTIEASDGGANGVGFALTSYALLGVVASSNGQFTFFDGLAGVPIDYDARRTFVSSATLQAPGFTEDGGLSYVAADGGPNGTVVTGAVVTAPTALSDGGAGSEPWRIAEVANPNGGGAPFVIDVSDGYLASQNLVVIYEGQLPGLVKVPTSAADGTRLPVSGGVEGRASAGDRVTFELDVSAGAGTSSATCGGAVITAVSAGVIEVDQIPAGCEGRQRFTVRAAGARPFVLAADLEGYLGRGAVGETVTYTRRYVSRPQGWQDARPALRVTLGDSIPALTGAYWSFSIEGAARRYTLVLDPTSCPAPQLPGRLVLGQFPTVTRAGALTYPWLLAGVLPSGNSVFELGLTGALAGQVGTNDGLFCYR